MFSEKVETVGDIPIHPVVGLLARHKRDWEVLSVTLPTELLEHQHAVQYYFGQEQVIDSFLSLSPFTLEEADLRAMWSRMVSMSEYFRHAFARTLISVYVGQALGDCRKEFSCSLIQDSKICPSVLNDPQAVQIIDTKCTELRQKISLLTTEVHTSEEGLLFYEPKESVDYEAREIVENMLTGLIPFYIWGIDI